MTRIMWQTGISMPRAEDITRARCAYQALRKARAKELCGHLPGYDKGEWVYHPERCSKKFTRNSKSHKKFQLEGIDRLKQNTEQSLLRSQSTHRSKKLLHKDAEAIKHVVQKLLQDLPSFIEHVIPIFIHPQNIRHIPDADARYAMAIASWRGAALYKNDLSVKLSVLRLAEKLL